MITLSILKLLEDNSLGTINLTGASTGSNLLWHEKLPEGKTGVYIISNPTPLDRNQRTVQGFDLYARGSNDLDGHTRLEKILKFFTTDCYPVCDLPAVTGYTTQAYEACVIKPTSNISNVGLDSTNRMIYVCSAEVKYNLKGV